MKQQQCKNNKQTKHDREWTFCSPLGTFPLFLALFSLPPPPFPSGGSQAVTWLTVPACWHQSHVIAISVVCLLVQCAMTNQLVISFKFTNIYCFTCAVKLLVVRLNYNMVTNIDRSLLYQKLYESFKKILN